MGRSRLVGVGVGFEFAWLASGMSARYRAAILTQVGSRM